MSIKLALECPTSMLGMIQPFADFDFVLAHKVLNDPDYADFYKNSDRKKILDNSVNELGTPCALEDLEKAHDLIGGATAIVSPDYIGDMKSTIESLGESLKRWKELVMPVLQGDSLEEALTCFNIYLGIFKDSFTLAVPYDIASKKTDPPSIMGQRRALLVGAILRIPNIYIHLLGFDSIEELFFYKGQPNVISMDTGAPVLLGLQGKDILEPLESKAKPTLNEMEELQLTQSAYGTVCRNIALLRKEL